jgi:hypothetical protein
MPATEITERVEPFVHALRTRHLDTQILLVENPTYQDSFLVTTRYSQNLDRRVALRAAYERLVSAGVKGIHYLTGESLLGGDGEATVDGTHPTDLGFVRQTDVLEKAIAPLLDRQNH